jgi:hypothetical protein
MRNKRGATYVTLLVFMALALVGVALFTFWTHDNKVQSKIANVNIINNFYSAEERFEIYIYSIALSSSEEIFKDKDLEKENLEELEKSFLFNFREKYASKYVPDEYYSQEIKEQLRNNANYEISIDKNNKILNFKIKNFIFSSKPGVEGNQEIGFISLTKNIEFRIPIRAG